MVRLIRVANPQYFITESALVASFAPIVAELGIPQGNIFVLDRQEQVAPQLRHFSSLRVLLEDGEEDWDHLDNAVETKRTPAVLLWTSGTSGLPKAAIMSHSAIVAQAELASFAAGSASCKKVVAIRSSGLTLS